MTIQQHFSLKAFNTFGIDTFCQYFSAFHSINELDELVRTAPRPLTVLGGGSNILLTQDIKGTVLKNEIEGINIIEEDDTKTIVKVGGGIVWHDFVMWSIKKQLGGIENLSLIPGSVGAAPMQNIGAYGVELESVFTELQAYHIESGKVKTFSHSDCQFGYRYSIFKGELKEQYIICNVTFKLSKQHQLNTSYGAIEEELKNLGVKKSIENVSQAVINIRQRKLPNPKDIGNSGSFFKNPTISTVQFEHLKNQFPDLVGYSNSNGTTKLAAGWLIEKAGWKGYRRGDAGVHKNQALVLVNYGQAKGEDILRLSKEIQQSVNNTFGISLEAEVNIL